eukprot:m.179668 g.179668  ORF g.179668 m.179668 type:complete len:115 (+) comp15480_c1_seq10:3199-3543(+)
MGRMNQAEEPTTVGLMTLLGPVTKTIDESVKAVYDSQSDLEKKLDALQEELAKFQGMPEIPEVLEKYTQKLAASRRKITQTNSLLATVQDRVQKLNVQAKKASKRKQAELGVVE